MVSDVPPSPESVPPKPFVLMSEQALVRQSHGRTGAGGRGGLSVPWEKGKCKGYSSVTESHRTQPCAVFSQGLQKHRQTVATKTKKDATKTKKDATRTAHSSAVKMISCSCYSSLEEGIKKMLVSKERSFQRPEPSSIHRFHHQKKTQKRAWAMIHSNPVVDFIFLPPVSCSDMFQCRDKEPWLQLLKIQEVFSYWMVPSFSICVHERDQGMQEVLCRYSTLHWG